MGIAYLEPSPPLSNRYTAMGYSQADGTLAIERNDGHFARLLNKRAVKSWEHTRL